MILLQGCKFTGWNEINSHMDIHTVASKEIKMAKVKELGQVILFHTKDNSRLRRASDALCHSSAT